MIFGTSLLNALTFLGALVAMIVIVRSMSESLIHFRLKLLWLLVALGIAVTALYPAWLDWLLALVGWGDRLNVALVIAVLFLMAMNFRTLAKLERLETKLARSVEDLVLREYAPRRPYTVRDPANQPSRQTPDQPNNE